MALTEFEFQNIRIYEHALIHPDKRLTIISGNNGSGKTTVLEAIHFLSTGKSFRTRQINTILRHGAKELAIRGMLENQHFGKTVIFTTSSPAGRKIQINGLSKSKSSEVAQHFPALVISPENHIDFQRSSTQRRSTIDWLLFHVEQDFHDIWYRYQRALQQRNTALKDEKQVRSRFSWDSDLIRLGEKLRLYREQLLQIIVPTFQQFCCLLFDADVSVNLSMNHGWDEEIGLGETLNAGRSIDVKYGFTNIGPHRSDLKIIFNNYLSRNEASNGQNKLLLIALRLAQIKHIYDHSDKQCCLLIDDFSADLDRDHRRRLLSILSKQPGQTIVTSTGLDSFELSDWSSQKTFHVKHGKITAH